MKPVFRNAMFGFHKEDVASFIGKQSKQYEKRIQEMEKEKQELVRENETLLQYRTDLAERENAEKILSEKLRVLAEKSTEIRNATDDVVQMSINLCADCKSLQTDLDEAQTFRVKAEKFDQLTSVLGGIVNGDVVLPQKENVEIKVSAPPLTDHENYLALIRTQRQAICELSDLCSELHSLFASGHEKE